MQQNNFTEESKIFNKGGLLFYETIQKSDNDWSNFIVKSSLAVRKQFNNGELYNYYVSPALIIGFSKNTNSYPYMSISLFRPYELSKFYYRLLHFRDKSAVQPEFTLTDLYSTRYFEDKVSIECTAQIKFTKVNNIIVFEMALVDIKDGNKLLKKEYVELKAFSFYYFVDTVVGFYHNINNLITQIQSQVFINELGLISNQQIQESSLDQVIKETTNPTQTFPTRIQNQTMPSYIVENIATNNDPVYNVDSTSARKVVENVKATKDVAQTFANQLANIVQDNSDNPPFDIDTEQIKPTTKHCKYPPEYLNIYSRKPELFDVIKCEDGCELLIYKNIDASLHQKILENLQELWEFKKFINNELINVLVILQSNLFSIDINMFDERALKGLFLFGKLYLLKFVTADFDILQQEDQQLDYIKTEVKNKIMPILKEIHDDKQELMETQICKDNLFTKILKDLLI